MGVAVGSDGCVNEPVVAMPRPPIVSVLRKVRFFIAPRRYEFFAGGEGGHQVYDCTRERRNEGDQGAAAGPIILKSAGEFCVFEQISHFFHFSWKKLFAL